MERFETLFNSSEEYYMARCLELAERGRGHVSPNPLVGCVVLDAHGKKVGEGYHQKAGGPHAEVEALNQAGERAKGGTLYVNLEPCNHHGKTPPCTEKIIESGISRVICGTLDPNPKVSGAGRDRLQNSRISVRHGFLEDQCNRINEIFFHYIKTLKPFVTLKIAMTMDGKIASRHGQGEWMTSDFSRQYVHHLRSHHDAILTTASTVMADNPQLNVREIPDFSSKSAKEQPIRVILDRQFRLNPADYQVFDTQVAPTWVFTSKIRHNADHAQRAKDKGAKVFEVDDTGLGLNLHEIMTLLGKEEVTSLISEAGSKLCGNLVTQKLVNKVYFFYAPQVLADSAGQSAFASSARFHLNDAPPFSVHQNRELDGDLVVEAYPTKSRSLQVGFN